MPKVLERANGAAAQPVPRGEFVAEPRAEPVSDGLTIAGWDRCSSDVVRGALGLVALALDAEVCCLCWGPEGSGAPAALDVGVAVSDAEDRRSWLELARGLQPHAGNATAPDGSLVLPVRGPSPTVEGALAVRFSRGQRVPRHADLASAAAEHIGRLLASSEAHTARSTAYEALVEIGTQIQAEEAKPDAIFALIVERARELLQTDMAWLAMVDETGGRLRMKVAAGTTTPDFMRMEIRVGTGIGGVALKQQRPVAVRDSSVLRDSSLYRDGMPRSVHRALDNEGVISILCAPMLKDGGMLGALYVGTRSTRDFRQEEAVLLSALAAQAAVTIANARLYAELSEKNDALERAFAVHRMLTDASLAGVGLDRLAFQLAQLADRDLILCLADGAPRSARFPRHPAATAPIPLAPEEVEHEPVLESIPIMAGDTELGALAPLGDLALTPLERKALEHGATVIALELVKERAALEVEWRLQGELLEELLRSGNAPSPDLLTRAERFGVDLTRRHRLAVMQPMPGTAPEGLLEFVRRSRRMHGGAERLVAQRGDLILAAFGDKQPGGVRAAIQELQDRGRRAGVAFACGLSGPRTDLCVALREARGALALTQRKGKSGLLVTFDDLGPLRFMIDAPDTTEMSALVTKVLGVLAEHDARRNSELLLTLRAYVETGGHHPKTAERCHIHVSTLKYRLKRIASILERQLTDARDRFELGLAYEVLDVLEVIGAVPFPPSVRTRPS